MMYQVRQGLLTEMRPFIIFEVLQCIPFYGLLTLLPLVKQLFEYYDIIEAKYTNQADSLILQCAFYLKSCHRLLRQLAGYPIPLWFIVRYLYSNIQDLIESQPDVDSLKSTQQSILWVMIISYLAVYFVSPGYFDTVADRMEMNQAIKTRSELKNAPGIICYPCNYPTVLRSYHCPICQQTWMMLVKKDQDKKMGLIQFFVNLKIFFYYGLLTCQHISNVCFNLTFREVNEVKALPYLWKNRDGDYFNSFSKGVLGNIIECLLPLVSNKSVSKTSGQARQQQAAYSQVGEEERSKIMTARDVSGEEDDEESKDNGSDTTRGMNSDTNSNSDSLNADKDNKDEFSDIGKYNKESDKYVNWATKKLYTIIDVAASPLREEAIKETKEQLRHFKLQHMGNNDHLLHQQIRHEESLAESTGITAAELEKRKQELVTKIQQERQDYIAKQLLEQKQSYEKDPELKERSKFQMEMSMTRARIYIFENPENAPAVQPELEQAERNYVYLFGQGALDSYLEVLFNPDAAAKAAAEENARKQQEYKERDEKIKEAALGETTLDESSTEYTIVTKDINNGTQLTTFSSNAGQEQQQNYKSTYVPEQSSSSNPSYQM